LIDGYGDDKERDRGMAMGQDGRILPSSFPYPTLIYLPVTIFIPSGDEKSKPITAVGNFFNKNKSIFHLRAQCCNALSNKEMMVIDVYGDREWRGRECEIWKEKRENYDK
jgi:hypothetical protein